MKASNRVEEEYKEFLKQISASKDNLDRLKTLTHQQVQFFEYVTRFRAWAYQVLLQYRLEKLPPNSTVRKFVQHCDKILTSLIKSQRKIEHLTFNKRTFKVFNQELRRLNGMRIKMTAFMDSVEFANVDSKDIAITITYMKN